MVRVRGVRDHKERGALKEHDLVGIADRAKVVQVLLQVLHVGDERVHDGRPCAVERFVPDRGAKADRGQRSSASQNHLLFLIKNLQPRMFRNQHTVEAAKGNDVLGRGVLRARDPSCGSARTPLRCSSSGQWPPGSRQSAPGLSTIAHSIVKYSKGRYAFERLIRTSSSRLSMSKT